MADSMMQVTLAVGNCVELAIFPLTQYWEELSVAMRGVRDIRERVRKDDRRGCLSQSLVEEALDLARIC